MKAIDLNSDMGESEKEIDRDYCILDYVTSANVACAFHAGDPYTMLRIVERCVSRELESGPILHFSIGKTSEGLELKCPRKSLCLLYYIRLVHCRRFAR